MARLITTLYALIALIALTTPTAQANVLSNPGFEAGSGTNADVWEEVPSPNGTVTRSSVNGPHSGGFHAYMQFDNTGNATPGAYFIQQNLGANTFDTTQNYNFSFWAKIDSTSFVGQDVFFQVQWLDQDGSHGGGFKGQQQVSLTPTLTTSYQLFSFTNIDAPDDADSFLVRFQISAGAIADIANGFYVDDVSLAAVPEPASLALLTAGGLLVLRRRG